MRHQKKGKIQCKKANIIVHQKKKKLQKIDGGGEC
jgi:hypothetical protein